MCHGAGSAEGLLKLLKEKKNLLLCLDEMKHFVSKCGYDNSGLLPCTTSLFENTWFENVTKKSPIQLKNTHLSLLAASTVDTYQETWDPQFTNIGFNNRLFIVVGKGERKFAFPQKIPHEKKYELRLKLAQILEFVQDGIELDLTSEAREFYQNWYMTRERSIHAKRLGNYARRLMGLLAVGQVRNEIDIDTARKAVALCDWELKVRKEYDPMDADSEVGRMEQKIQAKLRDNGEMTKAALVKATNAAKGKLWYFNMAIKNMREAEVIYQKKKKSREYYVLVRKNDVQLAK